MSGRSGPEDKTRPDFTAKFNAAAVKTIIKQVLNEKLQDAKYSQDASPEQSQKIADEIKRRCKALNLPRYKYMVHVVIGEQRGEGVRMGCRCLWDQNTDNYASDTFVNVRWVTWACFIMQELRLLVMKCQLVFCHPVVWAYLAEVIRTPQRLCFSCARDIIVPALS